MRKRLLSLLMVLLVALSAHSVDVILSEGFENGVIDPTWTTVDETSSVDYPWEVERAADISFMPAGAAEGEYRAAMRNPSSKGKRCKQKLVTPVMNCDVNQPKLIFAHAQASDNGAHDQLKIYYRTSATGSWQLLAEYTDAIETWRYDTVALITPGSYYQIAFEGSLDRNDYGAGIVLDDIIVTATSECIDILNLGVIGKATSAEVNIADMKADSFEVVVTSAPVLDPDSIDMSMVVYYTPSTPDLNITVTGLQPMTDYYVYARSYCDDNESGYTNWVWKSFRTSVAYPLTESFGDTAAIPVGWTRMTGSLTDAYAGNGLTPTTGSNGWGYAAPTASSVGPTGSAHVSSSASTSSTYWLLTPSIDMYDIADTAIEMNFRLALSTGKNSTTEVSDKSGVAFYVLVSVNAGETWTAANTTTWSADASADYDINGVMANAARYRVNLNAYKNKVIQIAFVAAAKSGSATRVFSVDDVAVTSYDPNCGDASRLRLTPDVNSLMASWSMTGKQNATIQLSAVSTFATLLDSAVITTGTSYTFTNLNANTAYYVRVKQDCPDAAWVNSSCRTLIGMPYVNPFTSTTFPSDWKRATGVALQNVLTGDALPLTVSTGWSMASSSDVFPYMGIRAYASLYSSNKYWMVSPVIKLNDASTDPIRLSFMAAMSNSYSSASSPTRDADDVFAVLISLDGGETWLASDAHIWDMDTATTNPKLTDFTQVPRRINIDLTQYRGQAIRVAFYSGSDSGSTTHYMLIGNPSIATFDANCGGVSGLAINSTLTSVTATWNTTGYSEVVVEFDTIADFTSLIDSVVTTAGTITFNNLTPAKQYYLRVRQQCSSDDAEWRTAAFKMPVGIPFNDPLTTLDNWTKMSGKVTSALMGTNPTLVTSTSGWSTATARHIDGIANDTHASYNLYSTSYNYWLVSDPINMYVENGDPIQLEFDFGITEYSSTSDHSVANQMLWVLVSTDNGTTWSRANSYLISAADSADYNINNCYAHAVHFKLPLTQYAGQTIVLAFAANQYVTGGDNYVHLANISIHTVDANCQGLTQLRATNVTGTSADITWVAGGAQSLDITIATDTAYSQVVYTGSITGTYSLTNLVPNTRYYVKARQTCDTEADWTKMMFKTQCAPQTPAALGMMTFDDESSLDCWTTGFMLPGTSTSYATAGYQQSSKYGRGIQLSKSSVDALPTTYSDGAYAISPELDLGTDTITKYQVTFSAATTSTSSNNVGTLEVGIVTAPNMTNTYWRIKTIPLEYAADSTGLRTYVVSLADSIYMAEGDEDGNYGRYIMFKSQADTLTNYVFIDNVVIELASGCPMLIETVIDSIDIDGAHFAWENTNATAYEVLVATVIASVDAIPAKDVVFRDTVTTNEAMLTGLMSNMRYYAYVRSICTEDGVTTYSRWSSPRFFKTACDAVTVFPWSENFEAETIGDLEIDCWKNEHIAGTSTYVFKIEAGTSDYTGSNLSKVAKLPDMQTGNRTLLTLPDMMFEQTESYQMSLDVYRSTYSTLKPGEGLRICASNSAVFDSASITELVFIPREYTVSNSAAGIPAVDEVGWYTYTFPIENFVGRTYIYIIGESEYGKATYFDNIVIRKIVSNCDDPSDLTVIDIKKLSAELTWVGDSTKQTVMEIATNAGFTTGFRSDTITSGLSHELTGLQIATRYYVRIKQLCADGEQTAYTTPLSFVTECEAVTVFPWEENFNDWEVGDIETSCWTNEHIAGPGAKLFAVTTSTSVSNSTKIGQLPDMSSGTQTLLSLPVMAIPNENTHEFVLDVYRNTSSTTYTGEGLRIYVSPTGQLIDTIQLGFISRNYTVADEEHEIPAETASGWYTYNFTIPMGGNCHIVILGESKYGSSTYFDNLIVRALPTCPKVKGVNVTEIGTHSAMASIGDNTNAPEYVYVLTSSLVAEPDSASTVLTVVSDRRDSVVLTGLQTATSYYLYVRALCDSADISAWSSPVAFTTECEPLSLPYSQNFDALTSTALPLCWSKNAYVSGTTSYPYVGSTASSAHSGSRYLYFYGGSSTSAQTAILPPMEYPAYALKLSFYYKYTSTTSTYPNLEVGVMSDPTVDSTFLPVAQLSKTTTYTQFEKTLMGVPTTHKYIAIRYAGGTTTSYAYVDDIQVSLAVDVNEGIFDVYTSNVTTKTIDFNLVVNPDTAICHNYELVMSTTALTDSVLDTIAKIQLGSATTYSATGLRRETPYYFYVRTACDTTYGRWLSVSVSTKGLVDCSDSIAIGNGTTASSAPICGLYGYERHGYIYMPEDGLVPGIINSLSWRYSSGNANSIPTKIYLKHTGDSEFTTDLTWNNLISDAVMVYEGDVVVPTGLLKLPIQDFNYEGGNLMVLVQSDRTGSGGASTSAYYTTSTQSNCAFYIRKDTGIDDDQEYSLFSSNSMSAQRHNIIFGMCHVYSPCPKVTNLTATLTGRGSTTATLNWTASTGENLQNYDVYVGNVNPATFDSVPETYLALTDTMLDLTNLTPDTVYYAAVRANCNEEDGVSEWAIVSFRTYPTCSAIENLNILPVSKTQVTATWEFGGPALDTIFNYVLSTTDSIDWTTVVPQQANALTLDLTGLTPGQTYWLYVAQNCGQENSEYVAATFTMPADCAPVEALTAVESYNLVNLTWQRAAFGFETEWEVGIVGGQTQIVSEPAAMFYGLQAHTAYTAYVRAICSETEFSDSATVSFTTANDPEPCVTVTGGTESTNVYLPAYSLYNYSLTEQIYTAAEIGQAGEIMSLTFNSTGSEETRDITIYLAHTSKAAFTGSTDWVSVSNADVVFSGNLTFPAGAELTITLDRMFNYNGRDNLLLVVDDNTGSWESGLNCRVFSTTASQGIHFHSDTDNQDPLAAITATGTTVSVKNKIRFCFNHQAGECVGAKNVTVSNVTAHSANINWLPGGHEVSWNTFLSPTEMFDNELDVAAYDTVTTLSKALTGLSDDTDYHFYIRSMCDSTTTGAWVDVPFTTTAICLPPTALRVDSVTSTEAYLSWGTVNEGYTGVTYAVAYGLMATFDLTNPVTYQTIPVADTSVVLTGLSATSRYSFAVSEACDATYTSRYSEAMSFLTGCGVVTNFPWTEDFEEYSTGTLSIPCWTNQHLAGNGTSLFQISSTTQGSNATKMLQLPDMSENTRTQLSLPMMFIDEADEYEFDIDVYRSSSYATKTNEGLRIYISTDGTLTSATELAFIPRVYSVANQAQGIPAETEAGWYSYALNIPVSDTIQILVVGESQYGSATYADNFRVRRQPTCKRPTIVSVNMTATSAELVWTGGTDRNYQVEYASVADFSTKRTLTITADTTAMVNGLTPVTQYWFRVKGLCGDTAISDYSAVASAKTAYVLPFSENFGSSAIPEDWSRLKGDVTGTTTASTTGWTFSSSVAYSYVYSSTSSTANPRYTLVTPAISMAVTDPGIRLSFDMSLADGSTSTADAPSAADCAGREFAVVVSTDNGATWTKEQTWSDSNYAAIPLTAQNYKVDLSSYVGQLVKVGFYHSVGTSTSTAYSYIRLDNVNIAGYNNNCEGIENLVVTHVATTGTVVEWQYGQGSQDAVIVITTSTTPTEDVMWTDTVRNANTATLPTLPMSSIIHVFVKQICGGDDESVWAETTFNTPIGVPYHPTFTSSTLPQGWVRSNTSASEVFAGSSMAASTGTAYGDFKYATPDSVMNYGHFKSNVYGTSTHHWLVTPQIDMTPNVGQGVMLSIDLSLCDYGNPGQTADAVGPDDNFMVVVSEDGGQTWSRTNATIWQDSVNANYSYTAIPSATAQTYHIDLSRYTGKIIRIGFYAESTVSGGDNDLHLGNIHVEQVDANMFMDTICYGSSYQGYGFVILPSQYSAGTNSFSNYTPGTDTSSAVLDVLTLEVMPLTRDTIYASVCEGNTYTYDEYIYVDADEVEVGLQTIRFRLTSSKGCDSLVYLVLNGLAAARSTEYASTCSGIPYNWHGQDYYIGGTYVDTLQTIEGCDSICALLLTVEDVIRRDTAVTLCYGEELVINGETVTTSGIYTETIDNPEGCDEEVKWQVTAIGKLETHTRVVACKGTTYNDELIHGVTQDLHDNTITTSKVSGCDSTVIYDIWFADANETLYVNVPENELPFAVNGVILIAAGTAQGEYTRTVSTTCGDVTMVISVGQAVIRYTVTVKAENGMAYGSGVYVAGDEVEIGVRPFDGYEFKTWNDGNTENPRTIIVNADITYTGTCEKIGEGLEDVIRDMDEDDVLKLIENQQLIIIRGGVRYNAQGAVME